VATGPEKFFIGLLCAKNGAGLQFQSKGAFSPHGERCRGRINHRWTQIPKDLKATQTHRFVHPSTRFGCGCAALFPSVVKLHRHALARFLDFKNTPGFGLHWKRVWRMFPRI